MYSYVYSSANNAPYGLGGYDFVSGAVQPILPTVGLFSSFSFDLFAAPAYQPASTESFGTYAQSGRIQRQVPAYPPILIFDDNISALKIITGMSWVVNGGPQGNGVAFNERGDWFTLDALSKPDKFGLGIKLESVNLGGTTTVVYPAVGGTPITSKTRTVSLWNNLRLSGSYNSSVFCYNDFGYLDNNEAGADKVIHAKSLYELPEKFDQLVNFLPDQRRSTTLTFTVKVDYSTDVSLGVYDSLLFASDKQEIMNQIYSSGIQPTGSDYHQITHTINNVNDNWRQILKDTIAKQRTTEEKDARYNKTYKKLKIVWPD